MAPGGHIYRRTGTYFGRTQLDSLGNISDRFRKKSDQWSRRRCDNEKKVYGRTDGRMDGGWYTKNQNLAAESYGIACFKACKTNLPKTGSLFHLMKKHTHRLYCCFLSLLIFLLCMCAHSLIMVKIKVMAGYIFLLGKSFTSLLKFCTICIVHGF